MHSGLRSAASDNDASLTAPAVQMAEPVSGSTKSLSPVEGNAVLKGKLFKVKFDECVRQPGATDTLESNMMRRPVTYEL